MAGFEESGAVAAIAGMLAGVDCGERRLFPPTELYSEGWMLRLVLDAALRGEATLPFPVLPDTRWYSEARLDSPFLKKSGSPSNHLAEGQTHADGVLGHFHFRDDTEAGFSLDREAQQFVVIEAKMFSKLSRGTTHAANYDQAARNVACMAWAIDRSGRSASDFESIGFYVWAPGLQLERQPTFQSYLKRDALMAKVASRVSEYKCDPERHEELERWFEESLRPVVARMDIEATSWETLTSGLHGNTADSIRDFYERCLTHNRVS